VVPKDVSTYESVAGVLAKPLRRRLPQDLSERMIADALMRPGLEGFRQ